MLPCLWKLVALELGLAVLSDLLARANSLADSLLGDRFTNRISVRLIEHATQLDLASFEDPVFYDKLERARRQTTGRIGLLAAVLNVAQDTLSLISLSAGLIVFSPWLMVLLVAAVIPAFLGETHFTTLAYSVLYRWTPQRRLLDYIRMLGASNQSAKEVKIFGLGAHLAERYGEVSERIYEENKTGCCQARERRLPPEPSLDRRLLRRLCGGLDPHHGRRYLGRARSLSSPARFRARASTSKKSCRVSPTSPTRRYILKDLFEFFEMEPSIRQPPDALPAPRPIRSGFEFRNVGIRLSGLLPSWSLKTSTSGWKPQEKIALIGENGAGKTTLGQAAGPALRSHRRPDPPRRRRPARIRR